MMRSLSTTAVFVIAGILALLLAAYVFIGDTRGDADKAPHCTSRQGLDLVKAELFRRASALRGTNDPAFAQVARYSVLRAASRMYRRHHEGSNKVTCTGTIALDLPPGVAVVGGRRTLESKVAYELEPGSGDSVRLRMLSKADPIVVPLAAIGQAEQADEPLAAAASSSDAMQAAQPPPVPPPPQPQPRVAAEPRAEPAPTPAAPAPRPRPAPRREAVVSPQPPPVARAPAPAPVASARPSFNCRYARTRGEIAVCSNSALASLDRQMASQFYSALSVARPGQRAMLQRSRTRFLSHRDSCGSEACIAAAYRARMQEIAGIMSGSW